MPKGADAVRHVCASSQKLYLGACSCVKLLGMSATPPVPPEGELITAAIKRRRISARAAARRAGMSVTRWSQIVNGYQTVQRQRVAVQGPAETVARMAHVAGVSPQQLADAGRGDAAQELTLMLTDAAEPEQPTPEPETDVIGRVLDAAMAGLTPRQKLIYLEKYGDGVRREMEETEREHRDAG